MAVPRISKLTGRARKVLLRARMESKRSFPVGIVVRVLIAAALLAVVFQGLALEEVGQAVRRADLALLLAAFALNWGGIGLTVIRWRGLLRAQGGDAGYGVLIRSFLVGQFFNNLLPSTIGGDAVRAYDTSRFGVSKGAAVTTILVDRLLGLLALGVFALVSATLLARPAISTPVLAAALVVAAAVAGAAAWVILAPPDLVVALIGRLPVAFRRRLQIFARQLGDALVRFHRDPWAVVRGFLVSVVLQIAAITFYAVLGASLGFEVPYTAWFLIVPVAVLAMLAPVSVNAIGVREGIFAFLLASYGVGKAGAVAFAWLAYTSVALQAVLGGALYLARARRGDRPQRLSGGWRGESEAGSAGAVGSATPETQTAEAVASGVNALDR